MKNRKRNSEEGSAIILAILLLAFFMALSMNMYFLAQKKSERAGVKAKGVKVLSNIDGGASIGYYELSRASKFVTDGMTRKNTNGTDEGEIATVIPDLPSHKVYNVVVIEKYQQYFGCYIAGTTQIIKAVGSDGKTIGWYQEESPGVFTTATTSMRELWETDTPTKTRSIGGFLLTSHSLAGAVRKAVYTKELKIPTSNLTYTIECTRVVEYTDNKLNEIKSDELTEILVLFSKT